jgi:Pretoxin HINT domain
MAAASVTPVGKGVKAGKLLIGAKKATNGVEAASSGSKAVKAAESCNSFTAITPVLMADGTRKHIKNVKIGDKVLATSTATGKTRARTVEAVQVNYDTDLFDLVIKTKRGKAVIYTTEGHRFWDQATNSWIEAADLTTKSRLRTPDGGTSTLISATAPAVTTGTMWDLTVSTDHTFYVLAGETPLLVHNCGPVQNPSRGSTARRDHVDWEEELLQEVRDNPGVGQRLGKVPQTDPRWPAEQGWEKMEQRIDDVDIHYQYQRTTGAVDDLKVKDLVPGATD